MPKIKTHRGAAKRIKKTKRGKFTRKKAYLRHILTKKNAKRKRRLGKATTIAAADLKKVKRLLPHL